MTKTSEHRSRVMRAVKSSNTQPEMIVRRLLHSMGFRYRLHDKNLPGKPDIVFRSRRKAIFVHGCFWHGHDCARGSRVPKENAEYWSNKISRNQDRDALNASLLESASWDVFTVWECELKDLTELRAKLIEFLRNSSM